VKIGQRLFFDFPFFFQNFSATYFCAHHHPLRGRVCVRGGCLLVSTVTGEHQNGRVQPKTDDPHEISPLRVHETLTVRTKRPDAAAVTHCCARPHRVERVARSPVLCADIPPVEVVSLLGILLKRPCAAPIAPSVGAGQ